MFVRKFRRKNRPGVGVQIVRAFRDARGRPRQELMVSIGSAPEGPALDALVEVAEKKLAELRLARRPTLFPTDLLLRQALEARQDRRTRRARLSEVSQLQEEARLTLGVHEVFGALWSEAGLDGVWGAGHPVSGRVFRHAVMLRLAEPGRSKRGHAQDPQRNYGLEIPVEKFYRMMDRLDGERVARLTARVGTQVRRLLGGEVEVVFMDVTTLSFASEKEDGLRAKGYSKDQKPHRVQVVLALLQTREGLPLGYRVFPGNTAEVKTLLPLVGELRERYRIGRVVVVADAAMLGTKNLEALTAAGFEWVVAAKLRQLRGKDLAALAEPESWAAWGEAGQRLREHRAEEGALRGLRLVLRYCPKKAERDAWLRAKAVKQAKKREGSGAKGKGRAARYLRVRRDAVRFDPDLVDRDARFDGLHGVFTSLADPPEEIRAHYGGLWRIEQGFRVLKGTLEVRPVFHWTERRVRAHLAICYAAFALLRLLRWRYARAYPEAPLSEERLLRELLRVEVSHGCDRGTNEWFFLPSKATPEAERIYRLVGLRLPRRATPVPPPRRLREVA